MSVLFDFTPLFRSTVGHERALKRVGEAQKAA